VKDSWFDIGIQLGLKHSELVAIQKNPGFSRPQEWFREMLNERIMTGGLTWELIIEALEDITVDQRAKADELRRLFTSDSLRPTTHTIDPLVPQASDAGDQRLRAPSQGAVSTEVNYEPKPVSPVGSPSAMDNDASPPPVLFSWEEVPSQAMNDDSSTQAMNDDSSSYQGSGIGKKRPSSSGMHTPRAKALYSYTHYLYIPYIVP